MIKDDLIEQSVDAFIPCGVGYFDPKSFAGKFPQKLRAGPFSSPTPTT
jgi:hypothetical protein